MKKNFFKAFASVALAAAMGIGFVACDNGNKNASETDALEAAEQLVGEEVSKEEWAAAFDEANFDNVKIDWTLMGDTKIVELREDIDLHVVITIADGKGHCKMTWSLTTDDGTQSGTNETYCVRENGAVKYYRTENGKWVVTSENPGIQLATDGVASIMLYFAFDEDIMMSLNSVYEKTVKGIAAEGLKCEYKEEKKGYWLDYLGAEFITVKFSDKKIAVLMIESDSADGEYAEKFRYVYSYTYGGQSVTLPTVE